MAERIKGPKMTDPASRPWTTAAFFAWQERQADRYELVDGVPVRMMAGTRNVHDDIVVNVLVALANQLKGGGCRPFTGDGSIETRPGRIRRPDIGVDCGRREPNAYTAASPRVVVEVLSPSTRDVDTIVKLEEYQQLPSVERVLLVEPNAPEVIVWVRGDDRNWRHATMRGLDAEVDMPEIAATLRLKDVYDGVAFPPRPRLVLEEPDAPPYSGTEPP
jgi:Uma2 family endonuclease